MHIARAIYLLVFLLICAVPCASEEARPVSADGYGFSEQHPIRVKRKALSGPASERAYLDSLRGPKGEKISYKRLGSCCGFDMPGEPFGGMLDLFEVYYPGHDGAARLYLDMYNLLEADAPLPEGFSRQD